MADILGKEISTSAGFSGLFLLETFLNNFFVDAHPGFSA